MRFLLPILALALVLPTASAEAPSTLSIVAPPTAGVNVAIPIEITLSINDFACAGDTEFIVTLAVNTTGAAASALEADHVTFVVPAGSYLFDPWTGNASSNLTVTGDAATTSQDVTVRAAFAPSEEGSCVTSGSRGFQPSDASAVVHVGSGTPPTPPTPEPTPVTPTPTPVTPTPEDNGTANQTPTTPPTSDSTNSTTNGSVDQLPPGGGYIGDYQPTESANNTPAPALVAVLAAVGVAAVVAARRRR